MKKRIGFVFALFFVLFFVTGCGGPATERSVYKYLQKKYPGEKFSVKLYRDVTLSSPTGGCGQVPGHTWEVMAEDTNISFYVQDDYVFNSFTCDYALTDDYFDVYLSNKIKELHDSRLKFDPVHVNDIDDETGYGFLDSIYGIDLDLYSFLTEEDLAKLAVSTRNTLMEDERINKYLPTYFWYNIYRGDDIICSISFRSSDNVDYILEEIHKKDV